MTSPNPLPERRVALLFYNMGGPAHTDAVAPFLTELFADNDLLNLPLPQWAQNRVAERIATRRTPDIVQKYQDIGGGSPQLAITERLLSKVVGMIPRSADWPQGYRLVFCGALMRYTEPKAPAAVAAALNHGAEEIWLVSQYPHCSRATTGSSLRDVARALRELRAAGHRGAGIPVRSLAAYGDDPGFQGLWAARLQQHWNELEPGRRHLIVSAHNLPLSYIASGDPYRDQIQRCARQTLRHLGLTEGRDYTMAWQSAVGPVRWMSPDTRDIIAQVARRGVSDVLIWPVAFVSDHIETLHEIDIEFREIADKAGIRRFVRATNLNDADDFASFLAMTIARAAKDRSRDPGSLALRLLDESPSGEGCHLQTGGCLCGRYWQAGREGRIKGVSPVRLRPSENTGPSS